MNDIVHIRDVLARTADVPAGVSPEAPDDRLDDQRTEAWRLAVPKRFWNANLDGVEARVRDDLREWAGSENPPNLVLVGPVGTGKTWAALAAVRPRFFADTYVPASQSLAFRPVGEMLDTLRPGGPEGEMERLCRVGTLVIDDSGTERATDWTDERMYGVINRRWMEELPTVATTNLSLEELRGAVGERTYSRLVGSDALALALRGPDRRRTGDPGVVRPLGCSVG